MISGAATGRDLRATSLRGGRLVERRPLPANDLSADTPGGNRRSRRERVGDQESGFVDAVAEHVLRGDPCVVVRDEVRPSCVLQCARLMPIRNHGWQPSGAGTGRDAARLAELGHEVVAVEPVAALREAGIGLFPYPADPRAARRLCVRRGRQGNGRAGPAARGGA